MSLYQEALQRFHDLMKRVKSAGVAEPTAMTLATATRSGRPSARVVLLKGADEKGFVFYTNKESRKGRDILENPHACLCFFWDQLNDDQVRVAGAVTEVSPMEADAYWATRPRESQVGAWASHQSRALKDRPAFEEEIRKVQKVYEGKVIPRPPYWTGFRLNPDEFEFWVRRPYRLHERTVYEKENGEWKKVLLYP